MRLPNSADIIVCRWSISMIRFVYAPTHMFRVNIFERCKNRLKAYSALCDSTMCLLAVALKCEFCQTAMSGPVG